MGKKDNELLLVGGLVVAGLAAGSYALKNLGEGIGSATSGLIGLFGGGGSGMTADQQAGFFSSILNPWFSNIQQGMLNSENRLRSDLGQVATGLQGTINTGFDITARSTLDAAKLGWEWFGDPTRIQGFIDEQSKRVGDQAAKDILASVQSKLHNAGHIYDAAVSVWNTGKLPNFERYTGGSVYAPGPVVVPSLTASIKPGSPSSSTPAPNFQTFTGQSKYVYPPSPSPAPTLTPKPVTSSYNSSGQPVAVYTNTGAPVSTGFNPAVLFGK